MQPPLSRLGSVLVLGLAGCQGMIVSDTGEDVGGDDGGDGDSDGGFVEADCAYVEPDPAAGQLAGPTVSVGRGHVDAPFELVVTAPDGAELVYALDGTAPDDGHGTRAASPLVLAVDRTTILRVRALGDGQIASRVVTHTYLFVDDVLDQPATVAGYPRPSMPSFEGGSHTLDYEMDPVVVDGARAEVRAALLEIPTISLVLDPDDMFGEGGIYDAGGSNANAAHERPVSFEVLDPARPAHQLQIDAAIRPHTHVQLKRSFKVLFKKAYGPGELDACLFRDAPLSGDGATTRFDSIILRGGTNRSMHHWCNPDDSTYVEDQWMHDAQLAMSGVGARGTFAHLYVNGLYFGLYNPMERPDDSFAAAYLGGVRDDWFAINHGGAIDGDPARWDHLTGTLVDRDMAVAANYEELKQYLDVEAFADYLLLNWYGRTDDWPHNNWYGGVRNTPPGPFRFFVWDADGAWDGNCAGPDDPDAWGGAAVNGQFTAGSDGDGLPIPELWHAARRSPEFMAMFAARTRLHLVDAGGALTDEVGRARLDALTDHIEGPILAEAARWGDSRAELGERRRTRDTMWRPTVERLREARLPGNAARLLEALRDEGYFP